MRFGTTPLQRGAKADANIVAMLSLKLLLLAFFILFATMSRFEQQRSRAVMESVASTFRGRVSAVLNTGAPESAMSLQEKQARLSRRIEALFRQTLPVVEVETSAEGRVMWLEMPARTFFPSGEVVPDLRHETLLRKLVSALGDARSTFPRIRVEALHGVRPETAASADATRLAVDRSGALVRELEALGLPREDLAAGLWPTATDVNWVAIEIRFPRETPRANALPDSAAQAEGRQ